MSDKEKDKEVAHEIIIPDNTYGVFCTFDEKRNELQLYDGNFNGSEMVENIGIRIREVLESVVEEASMRLAEQYNIKPAKKVERIEGNIVYANFSKRLH
jgi:hypothetical protein